MVLRTYEIEAEENKYCVLTFISTKYSGKLLPQKNPLIKEFFLFIFITTTIAVVFVINLAWTLNITRGLGQSIIRFSISQEKIDSTDGLLFPENIRNFSHTSFSIAGNFINSSHLKKSFNKNKILTSNFVAQGNNFKRGRKPWPTDVSKIKIDDIKLLQRFARFAIYANHAYCGNDIIHLANHVYGSAILNHTNREIIITLRGEELDLTAYNKRQNILIPYPGLQDARVDRGFHRAYKAAEENLFLLVATYLSDKNYSTYSFWLTGHGLGGVYAVFFAMELRKSYKELRIDVITFAQPRMGNAMFADYVEYMLNGIYRITHSEDLVSQKPNKLSGYWHIETEYWIEWDCDCDPFLPLHQVPCHVWRCKGPIIEDYPRKSFDREEHSGCNAGVSTRYFIPGISSHYGPFFGQMMMFCPT
ncbi:hypothetical protein G9A89_020141 [Geosiphon pyriformis]|nr:hypothetical protein G9A89_020141 [Geosiphon pyriformis]